MVKGKIVQFLNRTKINLAQPQLMYLAITLIFNGILTRYFQLAECFLSR